MAQPEYGARYCRGAASEAVAATMTEYFMASREKKSSRMARVANRRTGVRQSFDQLSDCRTLLSDGDVDAVEFLLLVGGIVETLLIDDGIDGHGCFACLTIADDQFTLTTANRDQTVDGFHARLHRLAHGNTRDDTGCLDADTSALLRVQWTLEETIVRRVLFRSSDHLLCHRSGCPEHRRHGREVRHRWVRRR